MSLLDEYKQLYTSEIDHSERLNSKIGYSITFLTIQGTGNIIIWTKYFTHPINTAYLLLCFVSFVSFILSIFLFYRAFSGYEYAYFPTENIKEKIDQTYQITKNMKNGQEVAAKHIEFMFQYAYIKCAIINSKENYMKNNRHRKFTKYASISLLLIGIAYAYSMIFIDNIHLVK